MKKHIWIVALLGALLSMTTLVHADTTNTTDTGSQPPVVDPLHDDPPVW